MKDSQTATERVGRYQLLEPIGGGPSGTVSRAKVFGVAGFERQFAVKRFSPELTTGAFAQALSAAARSYGSLEHPRIARMSEFGVAQGQTFTAVEYVAGLDVFRLLTEAKLAGVAIAAGGALALVSQAARAVGYAHGRGLSHLGLSPTNVIVTVDGDVKVTDFGILAATMPQRPIETPRLASRIPYLSPEQLAGEATSAASDVFVLGVIAYELVTGQRAYRGDTPAAVAQAIQSGPPAEPPLPRPIVRVLQRCLARSPFERFPDARALADALDAALRVAPVPGTRKDVGAQVKTTLERYAALNEGNVSGMVALNLSGGHSGASGSVDSMSDPTNPFMPISGRPEARTEPTAMPVVGAAASSTMRDMAKPFTTVPGLAPPPIPVPPGVQPPPSSGLGIPASASTIPGLAPMKKPVLPPIAPLRPNGPPTPIPSAPVASTRPATDEAPVFELPDEDAVMPADDPATMLGHGAPSSPSSPVVMSGSSPMGRAARPTDPNHSFETPTGEMSLSQIDMLKQRASLATNEIAPMPRPIEKSPFAPPATRGPSSPELAPVPSSPEIEVTAAPADGGMQFPAEDTNDFATPPPDIDAPGATMPSFAPPPPRQSQPAMSPSLSQPLVEGTRPSRNRVPMIAGLVLGLGVLGAGGYFAYQQLTKKQDAAVVVADKGSGSATPTDPGSGSSTTPTATGSGSSTTPTATGSGSATPTETGSAGSATVETGSGSATPETGSAGSATPETGSAGSATGSAGSAAPETGSGSAKPPESGSNTPDNGTTPEVAKPTGTSDSLQVKSKPAGARVFIDGADQGTTPVKIPGTADRHTVAVLMPGHDLYVAEVDGQGIYDVALKPITPNGGHAGIKVIKCKDKDRYYVYVDGQPTGMTCPTERIDTTVGPHVVEVYDIVTETRRKFDIVVKDERLSVRVKIE